MDLTIDINNNERINIRTTGIIIHDNKVLLHHNINHTYYALIGGRVQMHENSEEALLREFEEETGYKTKILKHLTTIENFYNYKDKVVYEIEFVYELEFIDENLKELKDTILNKEGKDYLQYEWVDLDDIQKIDVRPNIFKKYFINNSSHLVDNAL